MHIHCICRKLERVATTTHGHEARRPEGAAKLGDETLKSVPGRGRWFLTPQGVDELISGYRATRMQRQHRQERPQLRSSDHDVIPVVVENLEIAEKRYLHVSTVPGVDGWRSTSASRMRGAQLGKPVASTLGRLEAIDGFGDEVDDVVVPAEVGEVFERKIDRPRDRAGTAQLAELIELSLSAAHSMRMRPRADAPPRWD